MQTNDHQTRDYSAVLDEKYGAVILDARREAKVSQANLPPSA